MAEVTAVGAQATTVAPAKEAPKDETVGSVATTETDTTKTQVASNPIAPVAVTPPEVGQKFDKTV